jgi:multidrug efflux pump subunit AcrB
VALNWRKTVLLLSAGVGAIALLMVGQLGSDFLPAFDEGAFVLDYEAPPGTSLAETDRILQHVETILKETPEVEGYSRRTGLQLGLSITEPNTGDFLVKLKAERARSIDDVTDDIRGQIETTEPALRVEFAGILGDLVGDLIESPSPVEIKLFSDDTAALEAKAHEVEDLIATVPGVVDTFSGVVVSGPALTFQVDPVRSARMGVTAENVAAAVQIAMDGEQATTVLQRGRLIPVRVRLPESVRSSLDALRALPIRAAESGAWFRLDQVADVGYESGVTEIHRDGLRQTVAVTARLEGVSLGTGIGEIKKALAAKMSFPPGMTIEYGGIYKEQQKSFNELLVSLILAVVLVFLVLLIEFRSFAHPVAIVVGSVLSLSGVVVAMFLTGTTLNIVSFMGMIMVVGIVAKNGILMLDAVEDHRKNGDSLRDALLRSGRRRFRPVLMTSLATILGMAPLAFAIGSGSELLQPLAIGVIGGCAMALVMSLVVSPVVYSLIHRE